MRISKSITKNAFLNTIKTVLGIVFPLVTYRYVSRVLGVDNLGVYTFSSSVLSYFLLLAALGISTYAIREGTLYREDRNRMSEFVSELFSINAISSLVSYVLLMILLLTVPFMKPYRVVILILSAEILFTTLGVSWVCNIYEDFLAIAVRTIVFQILSFALVYLLIKSENDLNKYVFIVLLSNSGANLVNFFYVRKKYCKFRFTTKIDWNRHLRPILVIFSTTVAITVYVNSDNTLLGFLTNDYQVGLYGTAAKIYTIIKNILAAVLMVLIPRFTILFEKDDKNELNKLFSMVFNILTVLMLPMCIGLFSLSRDIILIVSGKEFIEAAEPLKILSVAVVFSVYAYMYTQCVLIPNQEEKIVFRATVISAIVNISLNFLLIPLWGINAAAITTVIAEFITFLTVFLYSRKKIVLVDVVGNVVSSLVGCLLIYTICYVCQIIDSMLIRMVVSVGGSALSYVFFLFIVRNPVLIQVKEFISRKQLNT